MIMNTLIRYSWVGVYLLLVVTCPAWAQSTISSPSLNLFSGGQAFSLPVSEAERTIPLTTNPNITQLVTNDDGLLDRLEVTIAGLQQPNLTTERILFTVLPNLTSSSSAGQYVYRFGPVAAPVENFRLLLASLEYGISAVNDSLVPDILSSPNRTITITVVDDAGLNDTASVSVTLQAANQQPPQFNQTLYTASIPENATPGTLVTSRIFASDPEDLEVNYSIMDGSGGFSINSSTGAVTVNDTSQLDYEMTPPPIHTVTIVATDTDSFDPRSSTSMLTVNLTDVNDNPPAFTLDVYNFSVVENSVGAEVGTVVANDPDTVGSIEFFFEDTTITQFVIGTVTGVIRVTPGQSLDADTATGGQSQYAFVIIASDGVHQATATVNVEVINIEDQRPLIVPITSTRLLNLDAGQSSINLTGAVTPLTVSDDGNVDRGVATLRLLLNQVESSFPSQSASCRNSTGMEYGMCGSTLNPQLNLLSSISPEEAGSNNPVLVSGTDVYDFSGVNGPQSRFLVSGSLHDQVLSLSDDFSTSMWVRFDSGSRGLQYVLSYETNPGGDNRYFSFLFRLSNGRLNLFYNRDLLPPNTSPSTDLGYGSRVGLSFYWDQNIFGTLRDDTWHFIKLDVDFPEISFYIDGHVYYATGGHYHGVTGSRIPISDPVRLDMPARILDKTTSTSPVSLSDVSVRIGGSNRGNFNFVGRLRLVYVTSLMNNSLYTCIASCSETIAPDGYVPGQQNLTTDVNGFSTFYNPVTRTLYFNKASSTPEEYTTFVRSISYSTNDTLPPQEQGEGRRIEIRVSYL